MKTTLLNQQQTMCRTTLVLGVLTTLFTTFTFANNSEREDQILTADTHVTISEMPVATTKSIDFKKQVISVVDEIEFMDSVAVYGINNQSAIENTILENESIIESNESTPVFLDRAVEEIIREDNQIIESNFDNTTYPLDMEHINNYDNANKSADFKNRAFERKNVKA